MATLPRHAVLENADGSIIAHPCFDAGASLHLDALIMALDARPGPIRRAWLRWQKRRLERAAGVIALGGAR